MSFKQGFLTALALLSASASINFLVALLNAIEKYRVPPKQECDDSDDQTP